MADSIEVFAWPEATLYVYTGSTSGVLAYAVNFELQVSRTLVKYLFPYTGLGYAARSQFVETNKEVVCNIETLYAGASLYGMLASGANISATVNLATHADGGSSTFTVWSAQMSDATLQGGEGKIWSQKVKLIAPDASGV